MIAALLRIALLAALTVLPRPGEAHSLGLSQLRVTETAPARFTIAWLPSEELRQRGIDARLRFPDSCRYAPPTLSCTQPIEGAIEIEQLPSHAQVIVRWQDLRGTRHYEALPPDRRIAFAAFGDPAAATGSAWSYVGIGVEHILLGIDHLAFVASLVLLIGLTRRLVWAITAFTLSHSLTLGLSSLGVLTLPAAPVETLIAASIVLVAREALVERETLARRFPWLIAFVFGLIHGLGFAGALRETGLPEDQALWALLAFNVGVELGQLAVVLLLAAALRLARGGGALAVARPLTAYAIGALAMFWTLQRGSSMLL
ncbi:MAG: HupE/UreJ family protein [Pseudomonadota bacterium]